MTCDRHQDSLSNSSSVIPDGHLLFRRDRAYSSGKAMCERLKDSIPRQMFEIAVQAAIGNKVIARET